MAENLSNLPNRSPGIGSTENSKQDKPEEDFPGDSVVKNLPANAGDTVQFPDRRGFHTPQRN